MAVFRPARRIIDAHFHIGPYGTQAFEGQPITPIVAHTDHHDGAACAAYLERHGLQGGVIVPTYLEDQTAAFRYNDLVLDAVTMYETLVGGLWVSPLPEVESLNQATLARLPFPGVRALKIASNTWQPYSIDPSTWTPRIRHNMEQILDAAVAHQLVVHFHTGYLPGADPLDFEAFLQAYGHGATYQLVHMGEAIAPAFRFIPRFVRWVESGYDVYTDSSIVPAFAPDWLLRELDRHNLGYDRVLFATDAPWGRLAEAYWKIEGLAIDDSIKEQVFWYNASRLYGIEA